MNYLHYKGYTGSVKYSDADNCYAGKVLGMNNDLILYEGKNMDELRADFQVSIESYFESCEEMGIKPYMPVLLSVRIPAEIHGKIVFLAEQKGVPVDDIVKEALLQTTNVV
ncbi:MAG: type II toxin-antitoxin system HicB family antitoxin [Dysgonamonadaceae bacterium]|jgi:predicted HicB family RNase H-like nuclease|nr:type II toxin-antitoxin system HicB family antitoxin [Dysgonamonadaceae bacterium]